MTPLQDGSTIFDQVYFVTERSTDKNGGSGKFRAIRNSKLNYFNSISSPSRDAVYSGTQLPKLASLFAGTTIHRRTILFQRAVSSVWRETSIRLYGYTLTNFTLHLSMPTQRIEQVWMPRYGVGCTADQILKCCSRQKSVWTGSRRHWRLHLILRSLTCF